MQGRINRTAKRKDRLENAFLLILLIGMIAIAICYAGDGSARAVIPRF